LQQTGWRAKLFPVDFAVALIADDDEVVLVGTFDEPLHGLTGENAPCWIAWCADVDHLTAIQLLIRQLVNAVVCGSGDGIELWFAASQERRPFIDLVERVWHQDGSLITRTIKQALGYGEEPFTSSVDRQDVPLTEPAGILKVETACQPLCNALSQTLGTLC